MKWKVPLFYAVTVALLYGSIEGLCYVALRALHHYKGITYSPMPSALTPEQRRIIHRHIDNLPGPSGLSMHDPVLGWTPRPGAHQNRATINLQGIRGDREYAVAPREDAVRIAAFGDSFTFGSDVGDEDTWEAQLSRRSSSFEVLNFGAGAYGLDQAYLRYRTHGRPFRADIVIIGFMTENIYRHVNVFRPFYSAAYHENVLPKPRFVMTGQTLSLLKNPLATGGDLRRFLEDEAAVLRELGEHDYHYRRGHRAGPLDFSPFVRLVKIAAHGAMVRASPIVTPDGSYDPRSEAFAVTLGIIEAFYRTALEDGALPIVLVYPDRPDLKKHVATRARRYEPLLHVLRSAGLRHLDALDAFAAFAANHDVGQLTVGRWGHYSPLGNRIVADHLLKYLEQSGFTARERVRQAVQEEVRRADRRPR